MLQKYEERLIDIKKMLLELGTEVTMACERALGGLKILMYLVLNLQELFLRIQKISPMPLIMKSL